MKQITSEHEVEEVFLKPLAVLFKHSTACPISARALGEVQSFLAGHPEAPVYLARAIEERAVSQSIARRTGIAHQSPQIIVLRNGEPIWNASHFAVTADAIAEHLSPR